MNGEGRCREETDVNKDEIKQPLQDKFSTE
jgi:hypothetical protein